MLTAMLPDGVSTVHFWSNRKSNRRVVLYATHKIHITKSATKYIQQTLRAMENNYILVGTNCLHQTSKIRL